MPKTRTDTGKAGEAYVAGRLERERFRIIARNHRVRGGEIDIVALDDETLVFVEVRVRSGERVVTSEETVDVRKLQRIMLAADRFIAAHPVYHDAIWRVDLVAITLRRDGTVQRLSHLKNLTLE